MTFTLWFLIVGLVFIVMALGGSVLRRLPLSTSLLYLGVGVGIGPLGLGLIEINAVDEAAFLERLTEVAVIISLFTAGLKLRLPLRDERWRLPVILAFGSMTVTVALIAVVGMVGLGLSLGAAILLGAILSPTDPVLASDVQVTGPRDRDRLRFTLTGEAGLNDGTAFPFVMLGLGLLGLHEIGAWGWRWLAIDVLWAIPAGLGIGWLLGTMVGGLVLYLRRTHREAVGLDDFLALGLIALAYGVALLAHAYGFLAVFAAGVALRKIEERQSGVETDPDEAIERVAATGKREDAATNPETAPAYMTQAVLGFNEQLERIGEVGVMLLVGSLLSNRHLPANALWFIPILFLVIRPVAAALGTIGSSASGIQRRFLGWFGIRGIGTIYYLMFAIQHDLPEGAARQFSALVLTTVAVSVVVHGISVTPLMARYAHHETADEERPTLPGKDRQPDRIVSHG